MNLPYKKENGETMQVALCLIDSGYEADATYDFCADNSDWAVPCKGSSAELMSHYKLSKVNKSESKAYGMNLAILDTNKYKDMIAGRMRKKNGTNNGSWMVYKGCDREYAEQVTAEQKVNEKTGNGRIRQVWKLKTSHADNHYLDTEVYAMAAADIMGIRTAHLYDEQQEVVADEPATTDSKEEQWIYQNEGWLS